MHGADDLRTARGEGTPAHAALLLHESPCLSMVVFVATIPASRYFSTASTTSAICASVRSGAILISSGCFGSGVFLAERAEDGIEKARPAGVAQARRVRRAHVDDEIVGEVARAAETGR